MKIVIAGCGIAGFSAAIKLRELIPATEISIFDAEGYGFYSRMRLSELLSGGISAKELILSSPESIAAAGFRYFPHPIDRIDTNEKKVYAQDQEFPYDALILAVGAAASRTKIKGSESAKVIRNLDNVQKISAEIENIERCVVIGGGLLGLEAAFALKARGLGVTILETLPRLLPAVLNEKESALLMQKLEDLGYTMHIGLSANSIVSHSDGSYTLTLENGTAITTGCVIISAGIVPRTELAEAAGIVCDKGIVVDSRFQTSANGVYAIGDCAKVNGRVYGLWMASMDQGSALAEILSGVKTEFNPPEYHPVPKLFGINLKEIRAAALS